MELNTQLRELIENEKTNCDKPGCRKQAEEIAAILLETLGAPQATVMEYVGEHRLNPESTWTRPVYEIAHQDGSRLRLAFTGLSNVQVFSGRNRSTHCRAAELGKRLERFITGGPAPAQRGRNPG